MTAVSEGWALELRGDQIDLDDLRDELKAPFDPWVEDYTDGENSMLLLRSRNWTGMQSPGEMMDDARRLIDQINGAHLIDQSDARPISHGVTLRFGTNGEPLPVVIAATGNVKLRGGRARARGVAMGASPPEPKPSAMQRRLERAASEDSAADLLTFISRADNWFDMFKAMECVQELAGGQREVPKLAPEWSRARQTANFHRHAPSPKYPPADSPPSLEDVRALVLDVARKVI